MGNMEMEKLKLTQMRMSLESKTFKHGKTIGKVDKELGAKYNEALAQTSTTAKQVRKMQEELERAKPKPSPPSKPYSFEPHLVKNPILCKIVDDKFNGEFYRQIRSRQIATHDVSEWLEKWSGKGLYLHSPTELWIASREDFHKTFPNSNT